MANKYVKVEGVCPRCGQGYNGEINRLAMKVLYPNGVGALDLGTSMHNVVNGRKQYVKCTCGSRITVVRVKNISGDPDTIEFCKECGIWINGKIANGDNLCEQHDS